MTVLKKKYQLYICLFCLIAPLAFNAGNCLAKENIENPEQWITHDTPNTPPPYTKGVWTLPKGIMLDGERYDKNLIIEFFLSSVFTNFIWFEDGFYSIPVLRYGKNYTHPLPSSNALNKWTKPIKISIKTFQNNHVVDKEKYAYIISHLKELISIYSKPSNLEIIYVEENYPTRSDANVFIVLDAHSNIHNAFKNQRHKQKGNQHNHEADYVAGVRFTPRLRSQVEGFFIPNSKNEIQKGTCYLKPSLLTNNLTKALLAECMARILGIPEPIGNGTIGSGILGRWNSEFDNLSTLTALNGPLYKRQFTEEWLMLMKEKLSKIKPVEIYPNDLDLKIISMLYCPNIEAGMDKQQAALALVNSNDCLRKSFY